MEELLNKLIKKGWHPFGRKYNSETGGDHNTISFNYYDNIDEERGLSNFSIRELVSKESGLWQFVCENRMVKEDDGHITRIINLYKSDEAIVDGGWNYHYWLMICSILDETDLEQFLLDNIKVE